MCIYDYTPYVGCSDEQQHFYLQWMKCNKAAERNDKFCPLDRSVPAQELRKLSGNVLCCPIHRHVAVHQHEFVFSQQKGLLTSDVDIAASSPASTANTTTPSSAATSGGQSSEKKGSPSTIALKASRETSRDVEEEHYIDFGEELRREAREKQAHEEARRNQERIKDDEKERSRSRSHGNTRRRGGSQDLRATSQKESSRERDNHRRPSSLQVSSQYATDRRRDDAVPSPTSSSPTSPLSPSFGPRGNGANAVGLPSRPNMHRRPSAEISRASEDDTRTRSRRTSSIQNITQPENNDADRRSTKPPSSHPDTPSPHRTTHRASTATISSTIADRRRERSSSAERKQKVPRTPSSNRGRDRDILDRLRAERPDPTSNVGVTRHRRNASSTDITTSTASTAVQVPIKLSQPPRSRSRSADPQPDAESRNNPVRSSSQTDLSVSQDLPLRYGNTSRPSSRTRSRDPSPSNSAVTTVSNRPLPSIPNQNRRSIEPSSRRSSQLNQLNQPTRKWSTSQLSDSASPASHETSDASPSSMAATASITSMSISPSSNVSSGPVVRWNLPNQASESGMGIPASDSTSLMRGLDSPTLGKRPTRMQSLGESLASGAGGHNSATNTSTQGRQTHHRTGSGGLKRESHDSGYSSYKGGHQRNISAESSSSMQQGNSYTTATQPPITLTAPPQEMMIYPRPGMSLPTNHQVSVNMNGNINGNGMQPSPPSHLAGLSNLTGPDFGMTSLNGVNGLKKLVKTKGNDHPQLPSPPYGTKLDVKRPLPDAAYLPLPGENRGGGLVSKKSLGRLRRTWSGLMERGRDRDKVGAL